MQRPRPKVLMIGCLAGGSRLTLGNERGTAFLLGLTLVMVMTLLGVALFEMSTIEARLARSDVSDTQAFYCAEAQAAWIYNLYATASLPSQVFGPTPLTLADGIYVFSGSAVVDPATEMVTVTATCTLPDARTRTVFRNGIWPPPWDYGLVSGSGAPGVFGDVVLQGNGANADVIHGDIYVSGNVHLRGEASVIGFSASDERPTITVAPGKVVTSTSPNFDPSAAGASGAANLDSMPNLSNPDGTGVIDQIRAAVTNPDRTAKMKGTYQGATVYNLAEIFNQLGATNEGNAERNLARPGGCTFGVASPNPKCQIWQDLVIIGPRRTCDSGCLNPGFHFTGLPRSPSMAPQGTSFNALYTAAVNASPEFRQLGFTTNYASLGARLDAMFGTNPGGEGRVQRLVDLSVGTDPATAQSILRTSPPIFFIDGDWLADGANSIAYNGRSTVVSSKSMTIGINLFYLGDLSNVNTVLPASVACPNGTNDRSNCGLADMLGLVAKDDIWIGDPSGTIHSVSALLVAGRDINFLEDTSSADCCRGPGNPVTIYGTVMASRQVALARDWADPRPNRENFPCPAQSPCFPVMLFPADTSCGGSAGCWKFLKMDPVTGLLSVDNARPAFREGCVTTNASPLTPPACPAGSRRVTHFQLNINYDARLKTAPTVIPPGLPTGALQAVSWKDCGGNPQCL